MTEVERDLIVERTEAARVRGGGGGADDFEFSRSTHHRIFKRRSA
ncbi:hypothetical protein [Brevibacterium sp. FME17]|nr:hypothetical protein [Brevibacterium sp. FME17]